MSGEEGAAAVDTGSDATGDTGSDITESTGTEADGAEGTEGKAETAAEKRYKARLFGKEHEFTAEEMRQRLDDEYEWTFHGVGGKPLLQDGKPLTRKWRDIVRDVQMSKGAADAARRANEERKRFEQIREWGKAPENRIAFMQRELGIEDFDAWSLERAAEAFNKRQRMVELATKDPVAYERELRAEREQQDKLRKESEGRLQAQQQESERRQAWEQNRTQVMAKSFQGVGIAMNARTREIAEQICEDYREAGAQITFDELASMVRDVWHDEVLGYLDQKPDEELLKLFGDKRRERLRKAEIAAMKGAKKAATAETAAKSPPKTASGNGASKDKGGMTAQEFLRSGRQGGRI